MSQLERPYWPCYSTRWLGDKELNSLGWAEEGLLARMCNLAHHGHIEGYLTSWDGVPLTVTDIMESKAIAALRGRITLDETQRLLKNLMDKGRIGLDKRVKPNGAYFSPQMVRFAQNRAAYKAYGQRGGNPALLEVKRRREEEDNKAAAFDRAMRQVMEDLWKAHTAGAGEEFKAILGKSRRQYADLGRNPQGQYVTDAALEVVKFRQERSRKGGVI